MEDGDLCDLDLEIDFEVADIDESEKVVREKAKAANAELTARAMKSRQNHEMRRAYSEMALNKVLDWHLTPGTIYHIISGGDIDSLSYLRSIVKQQKLDYCMVSTWCMGMTDADELARWIHMGLIKRFDLYVGEIFSGAYADIYDRMEDVVRDTGGRICLTRNHSKVVVGFGDKFDFAIASSANMNTNPRIEQTTITVDTEVANFYKSYYDGLQPFNKGYESWTPWNIISRSG